MACPTPRRFATCSVRKSPPNRWWPRPLCCTKSAVGTKRSLVGKTTSWVSVYCATRRNRPGASRCFIASIARPTASPAILFRPMPRALRRRCADWPNKWKRLPPFRVLRAKRSSCRRSVGGRCGCAHTLWPAGFVQKARRLPPNCCFARSAAGFVRCPSLIVWCVAYSVVTPPWADVPPGAWLCFGVHFAEWHRIDHPKYPVFLFFCTWRKIERPINRLILREKDYVW